MRSSKYSLLTQYARVMFPVKDEERPIRYLFIAVHRIVAVQSLVSRSELLYARARRQGVGMKCRNNSLHSTKKYPSRFSHTRVWGEPQIKMVGNFWVLPRASLSRAAEAQVSFVKILRILPEIVSNFVQYTPPDGGPAEYTKKKDPRRHMSCGPFVSWSDRPRGSAFRAGLANNFDRVARVDGGGFDH